MPVVRRPHRSARLRTLALLALAAIVAPRAAGAQNLVESPDGSSPAPAETAQSEAAIPVGADWDLQAEMSGSLFFGNTSQTVFSTRGAVGRSDSAVALKSEVRFTYGEATDEEEERDHVTKRAWLATVSVDLRPYDAVSPFVVGNVESSLEKRIDVRYSAGVGNRLQVVRSPGSDVNVSLALLGEWSRLAAPPAVPAEDALVRWSARLRLRHDFTEHLTLQSETFYQPELESVARYTMSSSSSIGYRMRSWATIKLSVLTNYDSEARARGARTNNDGQMVVGVMTAW
jgi:hypothetical protein